MQATSRVRFTAPPHSSGRVRRADHTQRIRATLSKYGANTVVTLMTDDMIRFFCRHLLGLGWYEGPVNERGEFTEEPTFHGASGFLLQPHDGFPNFVCLVTAGHVRTEYAKRLSQPRIAGKNHSLLDIWGPRSTCSDRIPFDFMRAPALFDDDARAGLDYAIIALPDLVLRALRQTTVPVRKQNWIHQPELTFDFYAMLGLPLEVAQQMFLAQNGRKYVTTFQKPALIRLQECDLPAHCEPATNPQFVARVHPGVSLDSVVGMSGGPIFGFRKNDDGHLGYWPVAVQSSWLPKSRIVRATSIPLLASLVEQWIDETLKQGAI